MTPNWKMMLVMLIVITGIGLVLTGTMDRCCCRRGANDFARRPSSLHAVTTRPALAQDHGGIGNRWFSKRQSLTSGGKLPIPRARPLKKEPLKVKTIGMIGGMSWESTLVYYRIINESVRDRLGGLHSARCILYSVDFAEIESLQHAGQWEPARLILVEAAQALARAGVDLILICTNTMHKLADAVATCVGIPLLHIADPTAEAVITAGIHSVALLGTRFTMEEDFYRKRLEERYGLRVLIPTAVQRQIVHDIIYTELCLGRVQAASRQAYTRIIDELVKRGARGVILGCTEIGLLVGEKTCPVPVFDTARIHAEAAVDAALSG